MDPKKQRDGPPLHSAPGLTAEQLRALFDVLTHRETYTEAESFKDPEAITRYGHPFASQDASGRDERSASPLLQLLLTRIILTVPGVRDLPSEFWTVNFQGILRKLGEADLSESYDKGAMGTRKTLATAASVIHESVTRGMLGGVAGGEPRDLHKRSYDLGSATSLIAAWDDCVYGLVHGDLVDQLFDHVIKSDDFEAHSLAVRAAAEYAIIHLGSLLHHVFVLSAEGQYLLKLIENVHKLVPYTAIRQTLRIGNAATMLNAMIRLLLAKLGVGAISNWLGLTQNADDGMNLLQRIISMVLSWDSNDFRKYAEKIESAKDGPHKEQLTAIKRHVEAPRARHELARQKSVKEQKSIVMAIFDLADLKLSSFPTEAQHAQCLEYYSANLAIRDRDEITKVLCRQNPDLFTSAIRMAVDVFDSMIRTLHSNVDLREHISAMQSLLDDFIATSKPKKPSDTKTNDGGNPAPPSVEDFVGLVRRNKHLLYRYLHQLAENCPDVREKFREWAKPAAQSFKSSEATSRVSSNGIAAEGRNDTPSNATPSPVSGAAGAMSAALQGMFSDLPEDTQQTVRIVLDSHAEYMFCLERISVERMQHIIDSSPESVDKTNDASRSNTGNSMSGPGVYLSRWQSLLDETPITPDMPNGPIRHGRDIKGRRPRGKTGAVGTKDSWDPEAIARREEAGLPQPPDVAVIVDALGKPFRELVADLAARSGGS